MPTDKPRFWLLLDEDDARTLEARALAEGVRPQEFIRRAVLAALREPAATPAAAVAVAGADPALLARLERVAESLAESAATIGKAVPSIEDTWTEQEAVRGSLRDIAVAVGTLAGAIEPADPLVENFGPGGPEPKFAPGEG